MYKKYGAPFVLGALVSCVAKAEPYKHAIDGVFSRFVEPGFPGCAVAVLDKGQLSYVQGYGLTNVEHLVAIKAEHVSCRDLRKHCFVNL